MSAIPTPKFSVEEYLALDRAAEYRSEYHDGEILPIEAASWNHARVSANAVRRVSERLDGKSCEVANTSLRVRVGPKKLVYPDLIVVCGEPVFTDDVRDTITNPKVIAEVLSPSTINYDYGEKFLLYRGLPSFEEYLLIAQDRPRIEVYRKTPDARWLLTSYAGMESIAHIESLDIDLPLAEIYFQVTLPALLEPEMD